MVRGTLHEVFKISIPYRRVNDLVFEKRGIKSWVHEYIYHLVLFLLLSDKRGGTKNVKGECFRSSLHVHFLIKRNKITIETIAPKISNPVVDFSMDLSGTVVSEVAALGSLILINHASLSPAPYD